MQIIHFDRSQDVPIVDAKIRGPLGARKVRLVFDTGCGLSQIDTSLIENIGYGAVDGDQRIQIHGATGESHQGYRLRIAELIFFGVKFKEVTVGALDFEFLGSHRIDGLLGFDLIKELHLEVNGPRGELKILQG